MLTIFSLSITIININIVNITSFAWRKDWTQQGEPSNFWSLFKLCSCQVRLLFYGLHDTICLKNLKLSHKFDVKFVRVNIASRKNRKVFLFGIKFLIIWVQMEKMIFYHLHLVNLEIQCYHYCMIKMVFLNIFGLRWLLLLQNGRVLQNFFWLCVLRNVAVALENYWENFWGNFAYILILYS